MASASIKHASFQSVSPVSILTATNVSKTPINVAVRHVPPVRKTNTVPMGYAKTPVNCHYRTATALASITPPIITTAVRAVPNVQQRALTTRMP